MRRHDTAALPIAHASLRIAVALNWLMGAGILVLLFVMPHERWILTSLKLTPSPEADRVILGLRAIAVVGLVGIPLHSIVLRRLLDIIDTVRHGDPFIAANAGRLERIAWVLLSLQVLGMLVGAIADSINTPAHPVQIDAGFSVAGWLAVVLTFVLARVFAEGTRLRDDLQGTV